MSTIRAWLLLERSLTAPEDPGCPRSIESYEVDAWYVVACNPVDRTARRLGRDDSDVLEEEVRAVGVGGVVFEDPHPAIPARAGRVLLRVALSFEVFGPTRWSDDSGYETHCEIEEVRVLLVMPPAEDPRECPHEARRVLRPLAHERGSEIAQCYTCGVVGWARFESFCPFVDGDAPILDPAHPFVVAQVSPGG